MPHLQVPLVYTANSNKRSGQSMLRPKDQKVSLNLSSFRPFLRRGNASRNESSTPERKNRSVTFASQQSKFSIVKSKRIHLEQTHYIPSRKQYKKKELEATWYTADDYNYFRECYNVRLSAISSGKVPQKSPLPRILPSHIRADSLGVLNKLNGFEKLKFFSGPIEEALPENNDLEQNWNRDSSDSHDDFMNIINRLLNDSPRRNEEFDQTDEEIERIMVQVNEDSPEWKELMSYDCCGKY
mmetsp:Transcript_5934/g.8922  ORF Transcript_5934/g.8922 Transcript_5934/m.8922 type:complete len:241 (-) Transcript_5934:113-835(-)